MGRIVKTNIWDKPEDAPIELDEQEQWTLEVATTVTISTSPKYWGVKSESLRRSAAETLKREIYIGWPNVRVRIVPVKSREENASHGPLADVIDDWMDTRISRALKEALNHELKQGATK